jgi:uncharacterized OB-fold protein
MAMTGYRNRQSGQITLTPPQSATDEFEAVTLTGQGTVYSCTTLHAAATPFEKDLPFQIAIIELQEGPRLTARIEGQKIKIGDKVKQIAERNGVQVFTAV